MVTFHWCSPSLSIPCVDSSFQPANTAAFLLAQSYDMMLVVRIISAVNLWILMVAAPCWWSSMPLFLTPRKGILCFLGPFPLQYGWSLLTERTIYIVTSRWWPHCVYVSYCNELSLALIVPYPLPVCPPPFFFLCYRHTSFWLNRCCFVSSLQSVPFMMPKKQKAVVGAAAPGEEASAGGGPRAGAHREGAAAAGAVGISSSGSSALGGGGAAAGGTPGGYGGHHGAYHHHHHHHQAHSSNSTGNIYEDYEGYIMDLLKILAEQLGFHYDLYLVPDNKFGVMNTSTQEWNGMVREIIEKVSAICVCAFMYEPIPCWVASQRCSTAVYW